MKHLAGFVLLLLMACPVQAQDDPEYRMEIGGGVGALTYEGDFNGHPLRHMQPAVTLAGKYVLDPYMAFRLAVTAGKLKGTSADVSTYYPSVASGRYTFSNTLTDVSLTYEYNFFPYGTGRDYRGSRRLTPFVFGGIGFTAVTGSGTNVFTGSIPIGIGAKYKVSERVNMGWEWVVHFSMSDRLDGVKDPYGVKSTGLFKNTDGYSLFRLTLTYSLSPKCRTCNKDTDD